MRPDPLYLWLAALAICFGILAAACMLAGAVELSITGVATGSGLQNLSFSGDILNVTWNGTAWNITGALP
jgi:hypothetical protein